MVRPSLLFLILFIPFPVGYGQTQETKEKFQFKEWRFLYEEKCSKCHTLERVFTGQRLRMNGEFASPG